MSVIAIFLGFCLTLITLATLACVLALSKQDEQTIKRAFSIIEEIAKLSISGLKNIIPRLPPQNQGELENKLDGD